MILKIDIYIYTDKDASVLSLKKNPKTKQRKDLLTYLRYFFLKLGFTPCKAGQPLRGMELQEKESQKG